MPGLREVQHVHLDGVVRAVLCWMRLRDRAALTAGGVVNRERPWQARLVSFLRHCTETKEVTPTESWVLLVMADAADARTGQGSRLTVAEAARRAGCHPHTVKVAARKGRALGVLVETAHGGGAGDRARGSTYDIHVPEMAANSGGSDTSVDSGGSTTSGLSPSQVRQAYRVLSMVMDAAVGDEHIPTNPCAPLKRSLPAMLEPEPRILTPQEVDALRAAMPAGTYRLLYDVLAYTGARIAEVLALRRRSVDALHGRLVVDEATTEAEGGWR